MKRTLQVMKFGGTSVGDAACIKRVAKIVGEASQQGPVVAVVSAMGGVTNRLIQAAQSAQTGHPDSCDAIFASLRKQHETAVNELIKDSDRRGRINARLVKLFAEGERMCQGTALLRELTPRTLDTVSSLGERLSAPMVAGALEEIGTSSESVEATDLIVTDSAHGGADPVMDLTREKSQAALRQMLEKGVTPVVTGFIGATKSGELTTLGRGGSDYSATILGAALDAGEVIIWTDVDGVLTADPRQVPEAQIIPEISYREATELAYFGAKVLHPKTMSAVQQAGIPVWIRNSFAPERPGTKITPSGRSNGGGVKALTAIRDVVLISVGGPGIVGVPDVIARTFTTTAELHANVLLISQSSSQNDICFIVASADANRTADALRKEFAQDVKHEKVEHISMNPSIAIVAAVGENMRGAPGIAGRTFGCLGRENINIIAIAQGSSETNISFVIDEKDMKAALAATHREFGLGTKAARELTTQGSRNA
jgi:bifunctional aspartokinase / homoserine dehydrogenase 1